MNRDYWNVHVASGIKDEDLVEDQSEFIKKSQDHPVIKGEVPYEIKKDHMDS